MGRPRKSYEEKAKAGTLNPTRERQYREQEALEATAAAVPKLVPKPLTVPARSYAAIAEAYEAGVLAGRIVACRWVKLAVRRQARDLEEAEAGGPYVWDPDAGARACHFLEHLPHVEERWATETIKLEPWQAWLVMLAYGWRQRADPSCRRYTQVFFEVGRKSAKTTLMAGFAYLHLLEDGQVGAQVVCGATTGLQARIVFGMMQKMGRRSAYLVSRGVKVFGNAILVGDSEVKPVNSKASSLDGLNPSMVILDESHAQGFGLFNVLTSAQGGRANPQVVCPTTAGHDLTTVGYAMHQQAERVLERVYDAPNLLAVIYALDPEDDWRDERCWVKANPMIGVTPKLERVREECLRAIQMPGNQSEFRVKRCNQWLQGASRWLNMLAWDQCADAALRLEQFLGWKCWIGADLAALDDLAAIALLFERGDELVAFIRAYLPADVVRIRALTVPAYQAWADAGLLVLTEGTMIDYARIEADLRADCARFKVQEIAFDQYGSNQICGNLASSGLPATIEAKRAATFTPPARDLETRVNHGKFRHDGNSLFKFAASNAVVERRTDDSILPKKESADSPNKIDPIDATLQAMASRLRGLRSHKELQMIVLGGRRA